jgi:hypothetical protein
VRELKGHAHWVNAMALSTDYALRTGGCDGMYIRFNFDMLSI